MNRLGIIFILFALVVSTIFTFIIYKHQKNKTSASNAQTASILVATRNLSRGMKLEASDVTWAEWPKYAISPSFIIKGVRSEDTLIGAIVRSPITESEPITDSMLIAKDNLNPLAAILKPGMRAYTIEVNLDAALAGLLSPGDRVDVLLTYEINKPGSVEKFYVSKTILQGISVLAVDQEISAQPIAAPKSSSLGKPTSYSNKKNVTLEVTPQEAEILAQGKEMGTLSLSLSSLVQVNEPAPSPTNKPEKASVMLFHGEREEQIGNQ